MPTKITTTLMYQDRDKRIERTLDTELELELEIGEVIFLNAPGQKETAYEVKSMGCRTHYFDDEGDVISRIYVLERER